MYVSVHEQLHGTSFMVEHDAGMAVARDNGKADILVYPIIILLNPPVGTPI